jgi:hypothetical protein
MGLRSHREGGYDRKTQVGDIARVLDVFEIDKADLVTHPKLTSCKVAG